MNLTASKLLSYGGLVLAVLVVSVSCSTYVNLNQGKVGKVLEGKSQLNLTIGKLLRKQAKF